MGTLKYRLAATLPILAALAFWIAARRVGGPAAMPAAHHIIVTLAKLCAVAGALVGAAPFERGGHLRRAWLYLGGCYLLLIINNLVLGFGSHDGHVQFSRTVAIARGITVTLANISSCYGLWLFARAQSVAGLHFQEDRRRRWALQVASAVIALAIAGPPLVADVRALAHGNAEMFLAVGSDVGDIIGFCLLGPVLLTALSLLGGLLGWPWALLALSQIGWLLYDATGVLGRLAGMPAADQRSLEEAFRVLACLYSMSAGLAQRWVLRRPGS